MTYAALDATTFQILVLVLLALILLIVLPVWRR